MGVSIGSRFIFATRYTIHVCAAQCLAARPATTRCQLQVEPFRVTQTITLPLATVTVREARQLTVPFAFEVISPRESVVLQARSAARSVDSAARSVDIATPSVDSAARGIGSATC